MGGVVLFSAVVAVSLQLIQKPEVIEKTIVIREPAEVDFRLYPCVHPSGKCAQVIPNVLLNGNGKLDKVCDIVSVHLPKTGGTTLESFLMDHVRFSEKYYASRVGQFNSIVSRDFKPSPVLFYSKRSYGVHHYMPDTRCVFQVMAMRDPIETVFSGYYYTQKYNVVLDLQGVSIQEGIRLYANAWAELDNFFIRLLAGPEYPELFHHSEVTTLKARKNGGLTDYRLPPVTEEHYQHALYILKNEISFLLITEYLDESIQMLSNVLGVTPSSKLKIMCGQEPCPPSRMKSDPYAELRENKDLMETIRLHNLYSIRLYEEGLKIFDEQRKRYSNIVY